MEILVELDEMEREGRAAAEAASSSAELEATKARFLGRKDGRLSTLLRSLGSLSPEERPRVGARANEVKAALQASLEAAADRLGAADEPWPEVDLTLPGRREWRGGRHPVTLVVDEICGIFAEMGFTRARGPEAETEHYNFTALNTPLDHPAADEQDTLYLKDSALLRSHTSPVQVRIMESYPPPIRIVCPGMVYRRDSYDATHAPAFMQIEGLVVDEGVTFVDFKATLAEFSRRFWGPGTEVRFRPSYFPFTEPSAEVDVKRGTTEPDGTRTEGDWLEIMGAGMVDPAVLEGVGLDPERYSGFAFGMGPGRIAMLRYGITDIRAFFDDDVRFLQQFQDR